ncbi:MAG: hypothetical protein Q9166_007800 [cf. Caloplaca sp. 2 TL-2023]
MNSSDPPATRLGSILLEASWALFGISFLILGLRLFSDLYFMRSFKLPSFFTLLGLLFANRTLGQLLGLAGQILITYSVHWGLGRHIEGLDPKQIEMTMTYIWNAQPVQLLANASGKLAIATLLVTLHGPKFAKAKSIFIWTLAGTQTTIVVIAIAMIYAQCKPVQKLWKVSLPGVCDGRERNEGWAYLQGGVSSSVDLALAIYPIVLFWDLRIQALKKLILSVLFAFGIVYEKHLPVIVRTVNISRLGQTSDLSHAVAELVIWNTTEMYLVLIAGSLPGLRPLFNKRVRALSNRRSSYEYPSRHSPTGHKRDIVLKLSSLPHGRTKAFASSGENKSQESTENFFSNISDRDIMKTTEVNIVSGEPSSRPQTPRGYGDGQHGRVGEAASDLDIEKAHV